MKNQPKSGIIGTMLLGFITLFQSILYSSLFQSFNFYCEIFLLTGIFLIIWAVFELYRRHINLLRLIAAIIIVIMWIAFFTLPLPSYVNPLFDYVFIVFFTICIILLTHSTPKEWKKYEKNTS
mgnify:CR=1 FL=1